MKTPAGIALLLLLAGCAEKKSPAPPLPAPSPTTATVAPDSTTPPAPPRPAKAGRAPTLPFEFGAYGDCRSGHDIHARICAHLLEASPEFVVVSGDLVDWGSSEEDWTTFRRITRELREKVEYLPAPGNHDESFEHRFEKEFGLERSYYDRRLGDVHVFALDSNTYFAEPEQLRWLEEKASASDARHKIAVFHHPPFSLESFEYEKKPVRERLHPLLVKYKFCAAFCGHHHVFYSTLRDGVRYVVTAGGGAMLYSIDKTLAQAGDLYRDFHHYLRCTVDQKRINARVFTPEGVEVPEFAFRLCEHP